MDVRVGTVKKAECQRIDAFELWCWRRLLRVLGLRGEILAAHSKGDQSWVFFGRNDAEAETPVLWPPQAKSWLTEKDSDAGRNSGQEEEKGTTEDEMDGWHHGLDGREFAWTPGVGDGQGGLVCCDSWGRKESNTTEWLNWTELRLTVTINLQFKFYHGIFSDYGINKTFLIFWSIFNCSFSLFYWHLHSVLGFYFHFNLFIPNTSVLCVIVLFWY